MAETLKRITPEEVIADFVKSGKKPAQGNWFPKEGCACALGAKFIALGLKLSKVSLTGYFDELYGIDYRCGFAQGFDGDLYLSDTGRKEQAYNDGQAAWEAVKHLALTETEETK